MKKYFAVTMLVALIGGMFTPVQAENKATISCVKACSNRWNQCVLQDDVNLPNVRYDCQKKYYQCMEKCCAKKCVDTYVACNKKYGGNPPEAERLCKNPYLRCNAACYSAR